MLKPCDHMAFSPSLPNKNVSVCPRFVPSSVSSLVLDNGEEKLWGVSMTFGGTRRGGPLQCGGGVATIGDITRFAHLRLDIIRLLVTIRRGAVL